MVTPMRKTLKALDCREYGAGRTGQRFERAIDRVASLSAASRGARGLAHKASRGI